VCGVGMQGNQKQGVLCGRFRAAARAPTHWCGACVRLQCVCGVGVQGKEQGVNCVAGLTLQHLHRHTGAELV